MYQSGPIHGPSGSGLYLLRTLGGNLVAVIRDVGELQEPLELLDGHLLGGDGETAGDAHAAGSFVSGVTFRLGRWRAHAELDRALDHGERLSLAVDEPPPLAPVLTFINSASSSLSFSCCFHLPQGPFRRPVDAASGSLR